MLLTAIRGSQFSETSLLVRYPGREMTVRLSGFLALRAVSDMHCLAPFHLLILCVMHVTQVIPFSYADNQIRVVTISEETYFVGKDICEALGIRNNRDALSGLDPDETSLSPIPTPSGVQQMICVNESGLYHLIFKSRKLEAKTFRKWVTNEVLPRLRKSGTYSVTNYTLEHSGQLAMFPTSDTLISNELKRQMMDVALSTRSTKVRNLLRLLKPIVFAKNETTL